MKNIITIQHTQSVHHTNGMVGSWTDWDLSDLGRQQADSIGCNLVDYVGEAKFVLYSSDLKRAVQTAEAVGKHLGLTPILRTELREGNLGKACGKSVQWLRENLEQPEKTVDDRLFSDGESRRDIWNRLLPFFNEIMENDEENIILVSHGGLLSVFNTMFQGLPVESMNTCELWGGAGSVSRMIVKNDGKRMIRCMGDLSFLK